MKSVNTLLLKGKIFERVSLVVVELEFEEKP
jgi:hypothetical protein